ncbi:ABC transporter substrate-binding protein [Marinobacter caseinilyticus]|uniref:ABC transporter substrate-binding protein n=1 Tax=Marinobacter caseinilyticus TaxID=2692195 RepID=UPI001409283A|nr:ABC transporter substrate-binding protein [Marinobacter caseinilyticus]
MSNIRLLAAALCFGWVLPAAGFSADIRIGYIQWVPDQGPVLSNILPEPDDAGQRGAELALADNNTTGRFLNHSYRLESVVADSASDAQEALAGLMDQGIELFILNVPATTLREMATQANDRALLFNAGASDNALRVRDCAPNVLHTIASYGMLTDALGQWLSARRWQKIFLITGPTEQDQQWADSFRRASKRFNLKIIADKPWSFEGDLRRTASRELPLFTQASDYDAVVVADVRGDFGEYVPFNTWLPRPVTGTQGMTPVTWHRVVEAWGAAQLQRRFTGLAHRDMTDIDYAAWLGVRAVGEAVTRTAKVRSKAVRTYLLSDQLQLDGFKGRQLSFRTWNGQLRQPIPLVHPRALVGQTPIEGFLHPKTDLDTLGFDAPESQCRIVK